MDGRNTERRQKHKVEGWPLNDCKRKQPLCDWRQFRTKILQGLLHIGYRLSHCPAESVDLTRSLDPAPEIKTSGVNPREKLCEALKEYCNMPDFSDITFIVEGKPFYGHKLILSLLR